MLTICSHHDNAVDRPLREDGVPFTLVAQESPIEEHRTFIEMRIFNIFFDSQKVQSSSREGDLSLHDRKGVVVGGGALFFGVINPLKVIDGLPSGGGPEALEESLGLGYVGHGKENEVFRPL